MSDVTGGMGSVASSMMGAKSQKKAQQNAMLMQIFAAQQQDRIYQDQKRMMQPYVDIGAQGAKDFNDFKANPDAHLNTSAYEWQKAQLDKNMNRQFSARGRSNSTYGMNTMADAYGDLGAREYNDAYQRVLDPIKIGQGAAGTTGNFGSGMQSAYANSADNISNLSLMGGVTQAQAYQGMANANTNANNGALKAYSSLYGGMMGGGK